MSSAISCVRLTWRNLLPIMMGVLWAAAWNVANLRYHMFGNSLAASDTLGTIAGSGGLCIVLLVDTLIKPVENKVLKIAAGTAWVAICAVVYFACHIAGRYDAVWVAFVIVAYGVPLAVYGAYDLYKRRIRSKQP